MHCRFPLLFLLFCLLSPVDLAAHAAERVDYCFDGDTLKLGNGHVVRLSGIDTPERAHGDRQAQYYAEESYRLLQRLVLGKNVSLRSISNRPGRATGGLPTDRHKRLVAEVLLPDGTSVNERMVAEGAAFVYPHKEHPREYTLKLLRLQQEAMATGRGFWKRLLSDPIVDRSYIGNRNSLRFFPADCPETKRINPRNRVNFSTLEEAFSTGYAPARACPFWPEQRAPSE